MKSGIYVILNTVSGKMYVGSAVDLNKRWRTHKSHLNNDAHCNPYLQSAWNKYGSDSFQCIFVEFVLDTNKLVSIEQLWINAFNSANREIGYNIKPNAGSNLGFKPSKETLEKLSSIRKGKKRSDEFKLLISNSWKTRTVSEQAKLNMSVAHKGHKHSEKTKAKMRGRKHTEEACLKMRAAHRRRNENVGIV